MAFSIFTKLESHIEILNLKIFYSIIINHSKLLILDSVTFTKTNKNLKLLVDHLAMLLLKWFRVKDIKVLKLIFGPVESYYLLC
jgi:hypothetical protein